MILPAQILSDSRLSAAELRVLMALYQLQAGLCVRAASGELCRLAQVSDDTYLSRLTAGLQAKGWIEKKRLGNTGRVVYRLLVALQDAAG